MSSCIHKLRVMIYCLGVVAWPWLTMNHNHLPTENKEQGENKQRTHKDSSPLAFSNHSNQNTSCPCLAWSRNSADTFYVWEHGNNFGFLLWGKICMSVATCFPSVFVYAIRRVSAQRNEERQPVWWNLNRMWDGWFIKLIAVENVKYTYRYMSIFIHIYTYKKWAHSKCEDL